MSSQAAAILASTAPAAAALLYTMSDVPQMPVDLTSAEARIIGATLAHLASETKRNADAVVSINENLHVLTRLEQAQGHILDRLRDGATQMNDHERRLRELEQPMPGLLELRRWVVGGVIASVSMMGLALAKLVIVDVPRIPAYHVPSPIPPAPAAPAKST